MAKMAHWQITSVQLRRLKLNFIHNNKLCRSKQAENGEHCVATFVVFMAKTLNLLCQNGYMGCCCRFCSCPR